MLRRIHSEFASRRGIQNIAMAVDGTHIPFHPTCAATAMDYQNYKGWKSILCVAFVNPYHLFIDGDTGHPGRAGDNTVLRTARIMDDITSDPVAWLGPNGLIVADGGASDHDTFFLNPYHNPTSPERCWFNFCHSSTRFYVEEVFGRWKNRFRFLMHPCGMSHRNTNLMIYASMVLHNMITIETRRDDLLPAQRGRSTAQLHTTGSTPAAAVEEFLTEFSGSDGAWQDFYAACESERCPMCAARGAHHCIHMAGNRNGAALGGDTEPDGRLQGRLRNAPSEVRDEVCARLWRQVNRGALDVDGSIDPDVQASLAAEAGIILEDMQNRASRPSED